MMSSSFITSTRGNFSSFKMLDRYPQFVILACPCDALYKAVGVKN